MKNAKTILLLLTLLAVLLLAVPAVCYADNGNDTAAKLDGLTAYMDQQGFSQASIDKVMAALGHPAGGLKGFIHGSTVWMIIALVEFLVMTVFMFLMVRSENARAEEEEQQRMARWAEEDEEE